MGRWKGTTSQLWFDQNALAQMVDVTTFGFSNNKTLAMPSILICHEDFIAA